jgi:hypothetical protein
VWKLFTAFAKLRQGKEFRAEGQRRNEGWGRQAFNVYSPELDDVVALGVSYMGIEASTDTNLVELENWPGQLRDELIAIPVDQLI